MSEIFVPSSPIRRSMSEIFVPRSDTRHSASRRRDGRHSAARRDGRYTVGGFFAGGTDPDSDFDPVERRNDVHPGVEGAQQVQQLSAVEKSENLQVFNASSNVITDLREMIPKVDNLHILLQMNKKHPEMYRMIDNLQKVMKDTVLGFLSDRPEGIAAVNDPDNPQEIPRGYIMDDEELKIDNEMMNMPGNYTAVRDSLEALRNKPESSLSFWRM